VYISNLALLDAKHVTIGRAFCIPGAIEPGKAREDIHHAHDLVNHVLAVRQGSVIREAADVACVCREVASAGVRAPFEACAGRPKGDDDSGVVEPICICFACCFDGFAGVALGLGDEIPCLFAVPVFVACGVKGPVAVVGDDAVDQVYIAFAVECHLGVDDVWVDGVGNDDFCHGLALCGIENRAVVVDGHTESWDAAKDRRCDVVFEILH